MIQAVLRDHRTFKADTLCLMQALFQIGYAAHFTAKADLANGDQLIADGPVQQRGDHTQADRKITGSITQRNAAHDVDIYIQVAKEIPCTLFQHSNQQIHAVVVVAAAGTARCWKIGFGCKGLNFAQNGTASLHGTGHTVAGNAKRTAFQQHL